MKININNYKNFIKKKVKIYNSLTGKKELFKPNHKDCIGIYVCGPTVYNHLHLGNCRTFISFDLVFRYFKHLGYKVRYIRNITDIGHLEENEDKISKRSRIEGLEPMEIAQKYTISCHEILKKFNTLPPSIEPTASGHIVEQIDMIQELIKRNSAYEKNGSVYFDIKKYSQSSFYGKISHNKIDYLLNNKFKFIDEKRHFQDFSLWKKSNKNHIMNWNSPWGKGFPGWHIECSAMSMKYLGPNFDIHGGGVDLKFPHHECELAQSFSLYKKDLANYWMHINMLTFNHKKMSKSTGNYLSMKELVCHTNKYDKEIYHPVIIKFFIFKSHYRSILNFSEKGLIDAKKGYNRLMNTMKILEKFSIVEIQDDKENNLFDIYQWIKNCYNAINDDFNTPLLISYLFKAVYFVNNVNDNRKNSNFFLLKKYMNFFIFDILGLKYIEEKSVENFSLKLNMLTKILLEIRIKARKERNWILSDKIRNELSRIGISVHDEKSTLL
ncbi:cysteine--tRNA ligase [Blattabacterium cuenoti]|uniref:cysteine--tRNA ligase n=1 Tax=Blattabacterium cuenoti TaxID=1653831 RepID=UPI00163CC6FA|nr:cysteine--tRNA ligase [Blattabacterium cuenoti]